MPGITKKARIDRILERNSKRQAQLGVDSTFEERQAANEAWLEDLAEIFRIDPVRAQSFVGANDFNPVKAVSKMVSEYCKLIEAGTDIEKAGEIREKVEYIFAQSHNLFPFEFVLESLTGLGESDLELYTFEGLWYMGKFRPDELDTDDWKPSPREALTKYLNS